MGRARRPRQRGTVVALDPRAEVEKLVAAEVAKLVPSTVQGNRTDKPQVERRPMTLLEALGAGTGMNGMPAGFIPFARDPQDNNAFGPGHPLLPAPLDAPDPTDGQPLPRVFEYDVSWNLPGNGQREVPWQVLRIASTAVDIIRRCIEYRKRTLRGLKPRWVVTAEAIQAAYESSPDAGRENAEQTLRAKYADVIKNLTDFWREPWRQNGLDFGQWLNMLMEEHIVLDAVAIYPRKALSGDVLDFQILDGSTVKPLLDVQGARPSPPYAAFQQILYGFPRGEYGAAVDADGKAKPGYSTAALFYHRENVRANSPYGLSPVEQALIAARLYLKRQGWMLAEYDDGSTPVTWIIPSEDEQQKSGQAFTPQIRRAWEDGVNEELGGMTRRRHRAKVLPPGWQAIQTQSVDERYKPDYDLHLIKLLCGFFNVPITELGFSEAKGIGNSGLHEGMADVADKVSDRPDAEVVGSMITKLARQFQGCPVEVELTFVAEDAKETLEESQADDLKYKSGVLTLNDLRRQNGLPVFNFPEADMPLLIGVGPSGVTFLEGLHEQQKAMQDSQLALTQTQVGAGQAQIAQTNADTAAADDEQSDIAKELTAFNRWRRRNPEPKRPFVFKAAEPDDVDRLFELDPNLMAFEGWTWEPDLDKGAGWDPGVKRFRDNRGRFVRGLGLDAALDHLDEVVSRLHQGRKVRKGEHPRTDALHAAGLLQDSPDRPGELELSDAGRQHLVDRSPADYAQQRYDEMQAEADRLADSGDVFGAARVRSDADRQILEARGQLAPAAFDQPVFPSRPMSAPDAETVFPGSTVEQRGERAPAADPEAIRATETPAERLARVQRGDFTPGERAEHERISAEAEQLLSQTPTVEDARGATLDDKIRRAEIMYGTDRSKWPAAALAEERRIKMREASKARRAERVRKIETAETQHHDLTDRAPTEVPAPLPQLDESSSVQAMNTEVRKPVKLTSAQDAGLRWFADGTGRPPKGPSVRKLRELGFVTDDNQITTAGRRHLAGITPAIHRDLTDAPMPKRPGAPDTSITDALFPEDKGRNPLARLSDEERARIEATDAGLDPKPVEPVGRRKTKRQRDAERAATSAALFPESEGGMHGAKSQAASVARVRTAHDELRTRPGEWVSIAKLRERLGDMPRDDQDDALRQLATTPGVQVIPWDNQNALRQADRDAALHFGGQENHAIRFEPEQPQMAPGWSKASQRIAARRRGASKTDRSGLVEDPVTGREVSAPNEATLRTQIESDTKAHERLLRQAEDLDTQINFAESDGEREQFQQMRDRLDEQMATVDRRIATARKELARKRR